MTIYDRLAAILALLLLVGSSATAAPETRPAATTDRLIQDCVSLYYFEAESPRDAIVPEGLDPQERHDYVRWMSTSQHARKRFGAMPRAKLRQTLEPLLSRTRPGYASHTAVAFTLALHGIDVRANVDRMLQAQHPRAQGTPLTSWDKRVEDSSHWRWDDLESCLADGLARIYRKQKDPYPVRTLLLMECDASYGELRDYVLGKLLNDLPTNVLRIANERPDTLRTLAAATRFGFEGETPRALKLRLQSIVRGKDPGLAKAARFVLAELAKGA